MDLRGGRGGGGGGEQVSSEELCLEEQRDTVGETCRSLLQAAENSRQISRCFALHGE